MPFQNNFFVNLFSLNEKLLFPRAKITQKLPDFIYDHAVPQRCLIAWFRIITALNKPDNYILAVVEVPISEESTEGDNANVYYLRQTFQKEPDFGLTSVNYNLKELKQRS